MGAGGALYASFSKILKILSTDKILNHREFGTFFDLFTFFSTPVTFCGQIWARAIRHTKKLQLKKLSKLHVPNFVHMNSQNLVKNTKGRNRLKMIEFNARDDNLGSIGFSFMNSCKRVPVSLLLCFL